MPRYGVINIIRTIKKQRAGNRKCPVLVNSYTTHLIVAKRLRQFFLKAFGTVNHHEIINILPNFGLKNINLN